MNDFISAIVAGLEALPPVLSACILLAVGWPAALLARWLVGGALRLVRFDKLGEKAGLAEFLRKGKVRYSSSKLAAVIAYWIALLVVLLQVARILDRSIYDAISGKLAAALPNLAAGLLVGVVGYLIVSFIANFVLTIALNASWPGARLLSKSIKLLGAIIVATMALEQIGLGRSLVDFIFEISLAAICAAAALAFGLGCKDLARDAFLRLLRNLREQDRGSKGTDLEG
jgi:hypothetical protein